MRVHLHRAFGVVVVLSLLSVAAPASRPANAAPSDTVSCGKPGDPGLIVTVDLASGEGTPEAEAFTFAVRVLTPGGREVHRIDLESFPSIWPLGMGCTVVVNEDEGPPMLLDPASGETTTLTLPDGFDNALYPATSWRRTYHERRWAVLSAGQATHALLVDTATGDVTDLAELGRSLHDDQEEFVFILSVAFNPDQSAFLLSTDRDTWLVPTAQPDHAREIKNVAPGRAQFSPDGSQIVVIESDRSTGNKVAIEPSDGGDRTEIATGDLLTTAFWLPDGKNIILIRDGRVATVSIAGGKIVDLGGATAGDIFAPPVFAPSGNAALIRAQGDDVAWYYVDFAAGTVHVVDQLAGYPIPYAQPKPGDRWLTFFPSDQPSVEPGAQMVALDLESGQVRSLLTFDVDEPYAGILNFSTIAASRGGRYTIVNDLGANYPRFWLLDAQAGSSTEYTGRVAYGFSPDRRSLIVGEPAGSADKRVWRLFVMGTDGTEKQTLAESLGRGGVWIPV